MTWLSSGDLSWMRDMQEQWLSDTVVVMRRTDTSDGMGGYSESWAAVGTAMGRVRPQNLRGRAEVVTGGQPTSLQRWDITLEQGTDVGVDDRVTCNGRVYEVQRVNNDETWQTAVRVEAITYNEESARE